MAKLSKKELADAIEALLQEAPPKRYDAKRVGILEPRNKCWIKRQVIKDGKDTN